MCESALTGIALTLTFSRHGWRTRRGNTSPTTRILFIPRPGSNGGPA